MEMRRVYGFWWGGGNGGGSNSGHAGLLKYYTKQNKTDNREYHIQRKIIH